MFWNNKTNNLICLDENKTKFKRLDRHNFTLDNVKQNIKDGVYCDYHCYRPMNKYSKLNYDIYDLLWKSWYNFIIPVFASKSINYWIPINITIVC
jgi:hypothetical protein